MSVVQFDDTVANDQVNDDVIQPFQLEVSSLRGRLVRLGPVLDDILTAHNYPYSVSKLIAETVTLSFLLSSMLKYDGIFTLQTSSDGPVSMLVADVTTKGDVRACAKFDTDALETLSDDADFSDLVGDGYIAFTVDQGEHTERYQGIVNLKADSLQSSIENYFAQSEQIGTGIRMATDKLGGKKSNNGWRAGAIMLQNLPDEGGHLDHKDRKDIRFKEDSDTMEEDWRRANILLETCKTEEFLDPSLDGNNLLRRLFHEEGVRIFTPQKVQKKCRCSEERTRNAILSVPKDELNELAEDNKLSMTCEFCGTVFEFQLSELIEGND